MHQVVIRRGQAIISEVPAPIVEPGFVLVCLDRSGISVGTELSGMRACAQEQPKRIRRETPTGIPPLSIYNDPTP